MTENQNSDFREETGNDWTTVCPNNNSKGLSSRKNPVLELQNLYSQLQVEVLTQHILVEENSSTVLPEETNRIFDVIRRRPNICTTERNIQIQQQLLKSKVVPGNNPNTGTLSKDKILMIVDSHIRRVKRDYLQNSFDNAKSFIRYFGGAKMEGLRHYIIPSLLKEKPETVAIHRGSVSMTHTESLKILTHTNWQMKLIP